MSVMIWCAWEAECKKVSKLYSSCNLNERRISKMSLKQGLQKEGTTAGKRKGTNEESKSITGGTDEEWMKTGCLYNGV